MGHGVRKMEELYMLRFSRAKEFGAKAWESQRGCCMH